MQTLPSPYEYFGPILCIRSKWLYKEAKLITKHLYDALRDRGHINIVRPGKGKGNYALIEFESIRTDIKNLIIETCPQPDENAFNVLENLIEPDNDAIRFFATQYQKPEGGLLSRSEEHTSELQSRPHLVCRLLLEKKKQK